MQDRSRRAGLVCRRTQTETQTGWIECQKAKGRRPRTESLEKKVGKVETIENLIACGAGSRWVVKGIDASDKTSNRSCKKDEAPRTGRERRKVRKARSTRTAQHHHRIRFGMPCSIGLETRRPGRWELNPARHAGGAFDVCASCAKASGSEQLDHI